MRHFMMSGLISMAFLATPVVAQEHPTDRAATGHAKSFRCYACHGPDGISDNPTVPSLAGQNAGYLMKQLAHFKEGRRYDPRMSPVAESLSREDMTQLVAYFSQVAAIRDASDESY